MPASVSRRCSALWRGAGLRSKPSDSPLRIRGPLPRTGPRRTRAAVAGCCSCYEERERRVAAPSQPLSAKAEALDQLTVSADVLLLQVVQQASAPADHQEQTTAAVVIVLVGLEVLSQLVDA